MRSASFSSAPEDGADVLTALGRPLDLGYFNGSDYTPPADPTDLYLKATWSGDGVLNGDVYEMSPDPGVNIAILTFQKWDRNADVAIATGGEVYWLCVEGAAKPDVGKITLDVAGQASVNFDPAVTDLGLVVIKLMAEVPGSPVPDSAAKLGIS